MQVAKRELRPFLLSGFSESKCKNPLPLNTYDSNSDSVNPGIERIWIKFRINLSVPRLLLVKIQAPRGALKSTCALSRLRVRRCKGCLYGRGISLYPQSSSQSSRCHCQPIIVLRKFLFTLIQNVLPWINFSPLLVVLSGVTQNMSACFLMICLFSALY